MRLSARYLLERLSGPRTRADELSELRQRLVGEDRAGVASQAEVELAVELGRLRAGLIAQLGACQACAGCVRPRDPRWPGGHCCSAHTLNLFTADELAALALCGTTPGDLIAPRGEHRGCSFRSVTGCSLQVAHRPNICVRFVCRELEAELKRRGDYPAIARTQEAIRAAFARFVASRTARIETAALAELEMSLRAPSQ